jgi:predicted RNA polymerase sigma factor
MNRTGRLTSKAFETEALAELPALLGVATRVTKNPADAQDLVQDTLLKAMRAREQFEAGTNLRAWLIRILMNTFINRYRRGGLERSVLEGPDADPLADGWISAQTMESMRDPRLKRSARCSRPRLAVPSTSSRKITDWPLFYLTWKSCRTKRSRTSWVVPSVRSCRGFIVDAVC